MVGFALRSTFTFSLRNGLATKFSVRQRVQSRQLSDSKWLRSVAFKSGILLITYHRYQDLLVNGCPSQVSHISVFSSLGAGAVLKISILFISLSWHSSSS